MNIIKVPFIERGILIINLKSKGDYKGQFDRWATDVNWYQREPRKVLETHPTMDIKRGDTVFIMAGLNDDIGYIVEVLGFAPDGLVYLNWDCYWYGVDPLDPKINFQKLEK